MNPETPQRIKVIHVYKDFDTYNGLIETFLLMSREFDARKIEFKVCVFNYRGSSFGEKFRERGGKLDSLHATWEDNPLIIYKLYRYLKKEKPHIVQTYILKPNLYGRIAARLAGVPVIISTELTLKDQAPSFIRRLRDTFLHPLNAVLNTHTDAIICASEAIKKQWENSKTTEKLKVIYPPFDLSKLADAEQVFSRKKVARNGDWVIGIVGRLSEEKRHIDLMMAFKDISLFYPHTRLLIVGDGYLREQLERTADELAIRSRTTFTGFANNVFKYLGEMDIFVLPSRTEGSPLSIMEAMITGLPVISTRVGGIPEIVVDNETGILVQPGEPQEIEKAILWLLSHPDKAHAMGNKGRERIMTHFHPRHFINEHENIYCKLAAAKCHDVKVSAGHKSWCYYDQQ